MEEHLQRCSIVRGGVILSSAWRTDVAQHAKNSVLRIQSSYDTDTIKMEVLDLIGLDEFSVTKCSDTTKKTFHTTHQIK